MKVWITKYALSVGIKETDAEAITPGMVRVSENRYWSYYHGEGKDWHRTQESALKRADEMRIKKIASLRAQIAKLEKLNFAQAKAEIDAEAQ